MTEGSEEAPGKRSDRHSEIKTPELDAHWRGNVALQIERRIAIARRKAVQVARILARRELMRSSGG